MRRLLLFVVLFGIMSLTALAKDPETVNIRLGQTGLADKGKLSIKFVSILDDSRCPVGANCVWEGNAKVRLNVTKGKSRKTIDLNTSLAPELMTIYGYTIKIADLKPRPGEMHKMIAQPKVVTLTITQARA